MTAERTSKPAHPLLPLPCVASGCPEPSSWDYTVVKPPTSEFEWPFPMGRALTTGEVIRLCTPHDDLILAAVAVTQ